MTNLTLMDHASLIEQTVYDNLDRNYEYMDDEEIARMETLLKVVRDLRKQETSYEAKRFYNTYEDRYDYLYDTLDRGFTFRLFIKEHPQFISLLENENLRNFSDIPLEARLQYKDYLVNYLQKHWGRDGEYTEQDAINDFKLSNMPRKEEMLTALFRFKDAYCDLLNEWQRIDGCDLNELDANSKYPFDKSFDELDVVEWIDAAMDELQGL